jgi:hypothetical protein
LDLPFVVGLILVELFVLGFFVEFLRQFERRFFRRRWRFGRRWIVR